MEVNKLYKCVYNGVVVKCTTASDWGLFGGVVVKAANSNFEVGYVGDNWLCEVFKEYTPTQVLTNGHSYNIPDGCKATIVDGIITIESNVKHYKKDNISYQKYTRINGDKMIKILISSDGEKDIIFRDGLTGGEHGEECTEEEFMKVYNDAIKID